MKTHKFFSIVIFIFLAAVYSSVTAQPPQTPSPKMAAANDLFRQKNYTEAAKAFGEITREEPNNGRAWFLYGMSLHLLGQYEKAVEAFQKNVALTSNPSAMYNTAAGYARLNQKDKAFEWLEKAINAANGGNFGLETDEDFSNVRADSRFKATVENINKKNKPCLYLSEARQFDFWIGEWDVYPSQVPPAQAPKIGENKVERISEGCGLLENWKSPTDNGKSINYYDRATGKWYQYWIGSRGDVLRYEGSFKENAMSFLGTSTGRDGKKVLNRLTFFKIDENTVRQFAEISTDEGQTWSVSYDFRYVRRTLGADKK